MFRRPLATRSEYEWKAEALIPDQSSLQHAVLIDLERPVLVCDILWLWKQQQKWTTDIFSSPCAWALVTNLLCELSEMRGFGKRYEKSRGKLPVFSNYQSLKSCSANEAEPYSE
jgi:hypothetical protein